MDLGAGTGRLAIPLAEQGFRVTAVDPSEAMLRVLAEQAGDTVRRVTSTAADYSDQNHADLVLCVFSVLAYITTESELSRTLDSASRVLNSSGRMILSIPSPSVLHSFEHETDDMERSVHVAELGDGLFRYSERTRLLVTHVWRTFEDDFDLRLWKRADIERAAGAAGLVETADVSSEFQDWGAEYLVLGKRDARIEVPEME